MEIFSFDIISEKYKNGIHLSQLSDTVENAKCEIIKDFQSIDDKIYEIKYVENKKGTDQ